MGRALQSIVSDERQRFEVLNSSIMLGNVTEQGTWVKRWLLRSSLSLSDRLIAFSCAKAIFFRSSYAVLEWFKNRGMMLGLTRLCQQIAADTVLHAEFACAVLSYRGEKTPAGTVRKLVQEAVDVEMRFIRGEWRV